MADCPKIGKWGGCHFEARYDTNKEANVTPELIAALSVASLDNEESFVEALEAVVNQRRVYIGEACRTCGILKKRVG